MADYYPLISRAVAGLEKNNGENRRALYERARAALIAQLRGVTPALNESDITRERLALEESIRKVEAELARRFVESSRQPPSPKFRPIEPRSTEPRQWDETPAAKFRSSEPRSAEPAPAEPRPPREGEPGTPPRRYANPPSAPQESSPSDAARRPWALAPPPSAPADQQRSDTMFDRPQPRQPLRWPGGERRPPADAGTDFRDAVAEGSESGAAVRAEKSPRESITAIPPPAIDRSQGPYDRTQLDRSEPRLFDSQAPQERMFEPQVPHEPSEHEDVSEPMPATSYALDDTHAMPGDERASESVADDEMEFEASDEDVAPRRSYRDLIKGLAVAAVIIAIGGMLLWQWPKMVALYRSFRAPAVETVRDTPPATARPKITDRIEPGSQQTPAAPAPGAQPAEAAAQKVVLYEEDPNDPNGKRFVGSAIWRTETVTPGPGQPPELVIRADVEVPERKLAMTWSLRRNTDKGLPATHTVEIMFKVPADFPAGGISNVPGILMKQAEQTRGVPLAGLSVKVTPGFYLIGLSNMEADKERNLQLLKERAWFDIPVVYNNTRRAILAIEKGAPGERVFAEAFKAWKQ